MAWINMAYQFYLLSCFKSPQRAFGLASITPVVFTVQSLQWSITDRVIYRPFRTMLVNMPYVQRYCKFDTAKDSWLDFENGIQIIPVLARSANLQAQAVIGGILDELSFMQVIEVVRQARDQRRLHLRPVEHPLPGRLHGPSPGLYQGARAGRGTG